MVNIAFRVDGGPKTGMGHLMRCLALANAFPEENKIVFITKSEKSVVDKLEHTRYDLVPIEKDIGCNEEAKLVGKILKENDTDIFIGDTYYSDESIDIDENYFLEIKSIVSKTVAISPKVSITLPFDIVINGNVFANELQYNTSNDNTKFLLGPKYALLREEFQNLPDKDISEEVNNIIVTMGGGDPLNLTPKALEAIDKIDKDDIHVDVIIGPAVYEMDDILKAIEEMNLEVSLRFNPSKISEFMMKADIAVSAGGSTLYELAVTGTPAVVLLQAGNQLPVADAMEKEGTIISLGFGNDVKIEKLTECIIDLLHKPNKRKKMSRKGKELIDGLGAKRCVNAILNR
ncbi:MAG: UDP-2,4-diacetamido-2,4,6-trideoxy-beta-L-altropyranose hydrolase [Thermoplasmatota archaeon]